MIKAKLIYIPITKDTIEEYSKPIGALCSQPANPENNKTKFLLFNNKMEFEYYMKMMGFDEEITNTVWKAKQFSTGSQNDIITICTVPHMWRIGCYSVENIAIYNPNIYSLSKLCKYFRCKNYMKNIFVVSYLTLLPKECNKYNNEEKKE